MAAAVTYPVADILVVETLGLLVVGALGSRHERAGAEHALVNRVNPAVSLK